MQTYVFNLNVMFLQNRLENVWYVGVELFVGPLGHMLPSPGKRTCHSSLGNSKSTGAHFSDLSSFCGGSCHSFSC